MRMAEEWWERARRYNECVDMDMDAMVQERGEWRVNCNDRDE